MHHALRTATRVDSDTGTIGRRSFSSILPSSEARISPAPD